MVRLCRKLAECFEEGFIRAAPRIEPELGAAGSRVRCIRQNAIVRTEQSAVPFLGQRLPV